MANPRIAVCTTFPKEHFSVCAAEMLQSFKNNWPEEVKIYIQLDEMPADEFNELNNAIITILGEGRSFISGKFDADQLAFKERWKDWKPKSYLDDVVKFSHKVFALEKCADALKDTVDYLIWLDADVITKKPVDYEWLKTVLPADDEVVSYLHRKGLHSECGWVAYNMKAGGYELLLQMKNEYVLGNFSDYPKGATDCHVIDRCLEGKKFKDLCPFYVLNESDINVWVKSKLSERMTHRKGNRKHQAAANRGKEPPPAPPKVPNGIVDAGDMKVKTRNCLDHSKIKANVAANLSQIRAWATLCKAQPDGEVVICAAGPSLSDHIGEIKALQAKGAKVIAVKHAIDTLKAHGVKPWAVVLLDPRGHVEGFVKDPDPDPVYFVASMCDPAVVKSLNDHRCAVIGYTAFVNAGETDLLISADLPVSGGSATATRTIGLMGDMFGFKKFHIFGMDLCHHQKPDMNEKSADGQPKYMELTIGTHTHKGRYISRTFWTEGQFLAQSNEISAIYKDRKDLDITIYGDGMSGWLWKHWKLYKAYQKAYNEKLDSLREGSSTLDEFVSAISSGVRLTRGR